MSAEYWFLRKDRGKRITLPLTPEVDQACGEALTVIADGIAGGLFPHRPPEGDSWAGFIECPYCDTDGLGVKELRDRWERKRHDPRLARYLALVDPAATAAAAVTPELPDAAARQEITGRLDRTLFVEAGAGSGKTRCLVDRVVATVLSPDPAIPLRHVAAVTFTEKAGAELRDRLRTAFESELETAEPGSQRAVRAAGALDDLDAAAIGTLHSFAERILGEHPVEAGLPPLIEVRDEVASGVAFDNRWTVLRTTLLDDPALAPALLLAMSAGMRLDDLRSMALAFNGNWDLLEPRVLATPAPGLPPVEVAGLITEARRLAGLRDHCTDDDDKFLPRLGELAGWAARLESAADDPARIAVLAEASDPEVGLRPPAQLGQLRAAPAQDRMRRRSPPRPPRYAPPCWKPRCAAWPAASPARPSRQRRHDARRGSWNSTTCWCSPVTCSPIPRTAQPSAPTCSNATGGCCWMSSRTPTRSRSSWPSASPPARTADRPAGPTCPCRRAACSWSEIRSSPSTGSAAPTSPPTSTPSSRSATRSSCKPTSAPPRRYSPGSTTYSPSSSPPNQAASPPTTRSRRAGPPRPPAPR